MSDPTPIIQIHLMTGRKHAFCDVSQEMLKSICVDLSGQIFARASLVLAGGDEVIAFPGHAVIGITVNVGNLPPALAEKERQRKVVVSELSASAYEDRRAKFMAKIQGEASIVLSKLEFTSGESLYVESCEVASDALGERSALNNLFAHPTLVTRGINAGFTVWNTAQIISWSHYPMLEVPTNAWRLETQGHGRFVI